MSLVILERTVKEEAEGDPEELLVRHLVLLGEVAQVVPRAVSSHTHHLVQTCMAAPVDSDAGAFSLDLACKQSNRLSSGWNAAFWEKRSAAKMANHLETRGLKPSQ